MFAVAQADGPSGPPAGSATSIEVDLTAAHTRLLLGILQSPEALKADKYKVADIAAVLEYCDGFSMDMAKTRLLELVGKLAEREPWQTFVLASRISSTELSGKAIRLFAGDARLSNVFSLASFVAAITVPMAGEISSEALLCLVKAGGGAPESYPGRHR